MSENPIAVEVVPQLTAVLLSESGAVVPITTSPATEKAVSDISALLAAPDHTIRTHDKISPSKLNYLDAGIGGCPGFRQDSGTSAAAEEGTRIHEILDGIIKVGVRDHWFDRATEVTNLPDLPSGSLSSLVFIERIRVKWDDITDWSLTFCAREVDKYIVGLPPNCIEPEIRVNIVDEDGKQIMYGHLDLCLLVDKDRAVIFDWKFGFNPVHHASVNHQGRAYAVGVMQRHPHVNTVGVVFIQPKRNEITKGVFHRKDIHTHIKTIKRIRDHASQVSIRLDHPLPGKTRLIEELNPGDACEYCNRFGTCPATLRSMKYAVEKAGGIPGLPMELKLDAIQTPEQAAVAMAWVRFLSDEALKSVKGRILEIARANGGRVSYTAPDGTEYAFKIQQDKFDRVVGDASAVAEALETFVDPKAILAAAKLSIGALAEVVVPAIQAAYEAATGEALGKKAATEQMEDLLTSMNLLSRPDGYTESLRREKVAKTPKPKTKKIKEQNEPAIDTGTNA